MGDTSCRSEQETPKNQSLKEICFLSVKKHFAALRIEAVLDLPAPLIQDLLPRLTICQLDELQPALSQRGISTLSGWVGVLQDICGPNYAVDLHTEDAAKHEVMRILFPLVLYGFKNNYINRNLSNLNTPSFLWAAAKSIKHFLLPSSVPKGVCSLTAEQQPLLNLLEKQIQSISISQSVDLSKRKTQIALYILHRLIDHGLATKLVVDVQCPIMLAWLLHERGCQYVDPLLNNLIHSSRGNCITQAASAGLQEARCFAGLETSASHGQDYDVSPCKCLKLNSFEEEASGKFPVDPESLCRTFTPRESPLAVACPRGQIDCLEIRQCGSDSLKVLNAALPTFFCLRSLTLQSISAFSDFDVLSLTRALKRLSDSSRNRITDLSISVLPNSRFVEILLDSNPNLTSLHVEIHTVMWGPYFLLDPRSAEPDMPKLQTKAEFPLEKLTIKVAELQTDVHFMISLLRQCPYLTFLHVAGMRLPTGFSQSQFLTTFSESNCCLRVLKLEDMKLSDCLPDILNLLRDCRLEELHLNDCRLLESCSDKEESLRQLVVALKAVPTLHTLSLAQNRLAKYTCVLAEFFSGSSPSLVKRLDISSNFIQAPELQEFAERLRTHHPVHQLTLDLRKNPGDRDPATWNLALKILRPFCIVLLEGWKSTNTMVDHVSNM